MAETVRQEKKKADKQSADTLEMLGNNATFGQRKLVLLGALHDSLAYVGAAAWSIAAQLERIADTREGQHADSAE